MKKYISISNPNSPGSAWSPFLPALAVGRGSAAAQSVPDPPGQAGIPWQESPLECPSTLCEPQDPAQPSPEPALPQEPQELSPRSPGVPRKGLWNYLSPTRLVLSSSF